MLFATNVRMTTREFDAFGGTMLRLPHKKDLQRSAGLLALLIVRLF